MAPMASEPILTSRETGLMLQHPPHVVLAWIGHTAAVARNCFVMVAKSIEGAADAALSDLRLVRQPILVDLFTASALAAHAVEAHELAETGLSLAKVGAALGVSKRQAHLCRQLGAKMTAAPSLTPPAAPPPPPAPRPSRASPPPRTPPPPQPRGSPDSPRSA